MCVQTSFQVTGHRSVLKSSILQLPSTIIKLLFPKCSRSIEPTVRLIEGTIVRPRRSLKSGTSSKRETDWVRNIQSVTVLGHVRPEGVKMGGGYFLPWVL